MEKQIVWDFNGTVLDDVEVGILCMNTMLARRNMPLLADRAAYQAVFTFPITDYYKALGLDFDKEPFSELAVEWVAEYNKNAPLARIYPGVLELAAYFRQKGWRQILVSATEEKMLANQLAGLGLTELFDGFVGNDNIRADSKERLACDFVAANPLPTLFLGDTLHDAQVAKAAGCNCLLIASGHQSRAVLETSGCPVLDDLSQVVPFLEQQEASLF